jgi:hypothetical protein
MAVVLLVVGSFGARWWTSMDDPHHPKMCAATLAVVTVEGRMYSLQDQSDPGHDGCDGADGVAGQVDYDCEVHSQHDGHVMGRLRPNRPDGTCGMAPGVGKSLDGPLLPA